MGINLLKLFCMLSSLLLSVVGHISVFFIGRDTLSRRIVVKILISRPLNFSTIFFVRVNPTLLKFEYGSCFAQSVSDISTMYEILKSGGVCMSHCNSFSSFLL